jgi:methyl coenzyme M reductase subunit C-like uncharacterized protein (methanogenesis marker protein 7)
VLFTSYQQMRMVYDRVSLEIDYPTLLARHRLRAARCSMSSAARRTRAVRYVIVLARSGCAGRSVELRYH